MKFKRRPELYKGKRVDGLGYLIGKRFLKNGEAFISNSSTKPYLDTNRGYHYCDQVILESLCRDTGVYDSNCILVCNFDVLQKDDDLYLVYKNPNCNIILIPFTDDIRNMNSFKDYSVKDIVELGSVIYNKYLGNYKVVNNLYDINRDLFLYLKSDGPKGRPVSLKSMISSGNLVYLSCGVVRVIIDSSEDKLIVHPCNGGFLKLEEYYKDLTHKANHLYDIEKIYICTKHRDSYKVIQWIADNSWSNNLSNDLIKWDWIRSEGD